MIDPTLLEILVCPACRGDLTPDPQRSLLACLACAKGYPVREGIPVMLTAEAVDL